MLRSVAPLATSSLWRQPEDRNERRAYFQYNKTNPGIKNRALREQSSLFEFQRDKCNVNVDAGFLATTFDRKVLCYGDLKLISAAHPYAGPDVTANYRVALVARIPMAPPRVFEEPESPKCDSDDIAYHLLIKPICTCMQCNVLVSSSDSSSSPSSTSTGGPTVRHVPFEHAKSNGGSCPCHRHNSLFCERCAYRVEIPSSVAFDIANEGTTEQKANRDSDVFSDFGGDTYRASLEELRQRCNSNSHLNSEPWWHKVLTHDVIQNISGSSGYRKFCCDCFEVQFPLIGASVFIDDSSKDTDTCRALWLDTPPPSLVDTEDVANLLDFETSLGASIETHSHPAKIGYVPLSVSTGKSILPFAKTVAIPGVDCPLIVNYQRLGMDLPHLWVRIKDVKSNMTSYMFRNEFLKHNSMYNFSPSVKGFFVGPDDTNFDATAVAPYVQSHFVILEAEYDFRYARGQKKLFEKNTNNAKVYREAHHQDLIRLRRRLNDVGHCFVPFLEACRRRAKELFVDSICTPDLVPNQTHLEEIQNSTALTRKAIAEANFCHLLAQDDKLEEFLDMSLGISLPLTTADPFILERVQSCFDRLTYKNLRASIMSQQANIDRARFRLEDEERTFNDAKRKHEAALSEVSDAKKRLVEIVDEVSSEVICKFCPAVTDFSHPSTLANDFVGTENVPILANTIVTEGDPEEPQVAFKFPDGPLSPIIRNR